MSATHTEETSPRPSKPSGSNDTPVEDDSMFDLADGSATLFGEQGHLEEVEQVTYGPITARIVRAECWVL